MRHAFLLVAVCLLWAAPACLADDPHLVNERPVFAEGAPKYKTPGQFGVFAMRLSPDGKSLLYPRATGEAPLDSRGRPDWQKVSYELVLRSLASGAETVLPVGRLDSGYRTGFTRLNMFDPTGTKLALADIQTHEIKEGERVTATRRSMKIALYDIPAGKRTETDIEGAMAMAKFDRSGKGLIVLRGSRSGLDLHTAALPGLELRPLKIKGYIQSVCPAAEVICVWVPPARIKPTRPGQRPQRGPQRLVLYEVQTDREMTELPINQRNSMLDDWETQWTPDGRCLYYVDVREVEEQTPEGPRKRTKEVSRLWDRTAGKEAGLVGGAVPLGPGPTPTSVVLAKWSEAGYRGLLLHDAASGKAYPLGEPSFRPVHAWGSRVVYARPGPAGEEAAYVAEIADAPGQAAK